MSSRLSAFRLSWDQSKKRARATGSVGAYLGGSLDIPRVAIGPTAHDFPIRRRCSRVAHIYFCSIVNGVVPDSAFPPSLACLQYCRITWVKRARKSCPPSPMGFVIEHPNKSSGNCAISKFSSTDHFGSSPYYGGYSPACPHSFGRALRNVGRARKLRSERTRHKPMSKFATLQYPNTALCCTVDKWF